MASKDGKRSSNQFDLPRWTVGKVSLFQALGLKGATYPQFQPRLLAAATINSPGPAGAGNTQDIPPGNAPHPPGGAGGRYSYGQLQDLWVSAGGNPKFKKLAAAIAMAESGGVVNAVNHDSNGTVDRGLWQINSVHGAQSTFNAQANARAAVSISRNGTDWTPWATFNSGAYKKFLK